MKHFQNYGRRLDPLVKCQSKHLWMDRKKTDSIINAQNLWSINIEWLGCEPGCEPGTQWVVRGPAKMLYYIPQTPLSYCSVEGGSGDETTQWDTCNYKPALREGSKVCQWVNNQWLYPGPPRGLERPRANAKSGAPKLDCVRGVWGHTPRKFWDFTCSEVCSGGLFVHAHSTYIPVSCRLWLVVSDQKVRCTEP